MALIAAGLPYTVMPKNALLTDSAPRLIKPARLKAGATVALIAPSSPPSEEKLAKAIANLSGFGFKIVEGKSLRARNGYLAGADADRLADIHQAFENPDIHAVWCVRGGYGAGRLLPDINYKLIRKNPKLFIGYSDITALHLAFHAATGLVTFHGPVAASDFPDNTLAHFKAVVMEGREHYDIQAVSDDTLAIEYQPFTITPGIARGALTGGNLALLSSLAGTPYAPSFRGKIAFIEDVGEQPYRLDRMLTQLLQATDLAKAAGIALGVFNDCQPKPDGPSFSLPDALRDRLGALGIPVVYGIPFGHVSYQATLPYGIQAELNADALRLSILESAVQ